MNTVDYQWYMTLTCTDTTFNRWQLVTVCGRRADFLRTDNQPRGAHRGSTVERPGQARAPARAWTASDVRGATKRSSTSVHDERGEGMDFIKKPSELHRLA